VVETLKEMTGGRGPDNKGLTIRSAQQHGQHYMPRLLEWAASGELDPSFLMTHRMTLEDGRKATTSSSTRRTAACGSRSRPDPPTAASTRLSRTKPSGAL
jgi:hypothetical protein